MARVYFAQIAMNLFSYPKIPRIYFHVQKMPWVNFYALKRIEWIFIQKIPRNLFTYPKCQEIISMFKMPRIYFPCVKFTEFNFMPKNMYMGFIFMSCPLCNFECNRTNFFRCLTDCVCMWAMDLHLVYIPGNKVEFDTCIFFMCSERRISFNKW